MATTTPSAIPVDPVKSKVSEVIVSENAPEAKPVPAKMSAATKSRPGFRLAKIKMPDGTIKKIWRPSNPPAGAVKPAAKPVTPEAKKEGKLPAAFSDAPKSEEKKEVRAQKPEAGKPVDIRLV